MPPALIALQHGFRGPNLGIVNACAASGAALAVAADLIRAGRASVVVAGGTEAAIGINVFGSMTSAGAINPTDDPVRACKPFSVDRAGLVVGEGCGLLVLEDADDARARGARVLGEILGEAQTNDAHHVYSPEEGGASWKRTMALALESAGLEPGDVDVVSAHAASTPKGDLTETQAIKGLFGERAYDLAVCATKSMHGHSFGASGAIETVLALGGLIEGKQVPTINLDEPDPECDLDYVANRGRETKGRVLIKNSFGFGGTNACTVIRANPVQA